MSPKELIIEFLSALFLIATVLLAVWFFFISGYFENFNEILLALAPVAIFAFLLLVVLLKNTKKIKRGRKEGDTDLILQLNFFDKLISDVILYGLPIIIYLSSLFSGNFEYKNSLFQALLVFIITFLWQRHIFKKTY